MKHILSLLSGIDMVDSALFYMDPRNVAGVDLTELQNAVTAARTMLEADQ